MILPGTVYIVGAGPGDPDLITLKGMRCLEQAETVVYDRLVNPALLGTVSPFAELIYAGKEPKRHRLTQEEINQLLIRKARQGKIVVRLKGGDPFVFGRGGEECQSLAEAGVPFEVVPGVTSATAVPAYAGIPVTQRAIARSFTVVTGHTGGNDPFGTDWDDLPKKGTLVILMGAGCLAEIARRLIASGRDPETPAATIQSGTVPVQRVVTGTLANIAERAKDIQAPAITLIGEVVRLGEQIQWYTPQAHSQITTQPTRFVEVSSGISQEQETQLVLRELSDLLPQAR